MSSSLSLNNKRSALLLELVIMRRDQYTETFKKVIEHKITYKRKEMKDFKVRNYPETEFICCSDVETVQSRIVNMTSQFQVLICLFLAWGDKGPLQILTELLQNIEIKYRNYFKGYFYHFRLIPSFSIKRTENIDSTATTVPDLLLPSRRKLQNRMRYSRGSQTRISKQIQIRPQTLNLIRFCPRGPKCAECLLFIQI